MWLLALAVPAQGFAAATMIHCGSAHHGAAHAHAHAGHSDGDAQGPAAAHRDHAAMGHVHGDETASATPGDHHKLAKTSSVHKFNKASCSACASCCTAAALPSAIATFQALPVHDMAVSALPGTAAPFLTDGPERPPRTVLA